MPTTATFNQRAAMAVERPTSGSIQRNISTGTRDPLPNRLRGTRFLAERHMERSRPSAGAAQGSCVLLLSAYCLAGSAAQRARIASSSLKPSGTTGLGLLA